MAGIKKMLETFNVHTIRVLDDNKNRFDRELLELKIEQRRDISHDEMFGIILDGYFKEKNKRLKEVVKNGKDIGPRIAG